MIWEGTGVSFGFIPEFTDYLRPEAALVSRDAEHDCIIDVT